MCREIENACKDSQRECVCVCVCVCVCRDRDRECVER